MRPSDPASIKRHLDALTLETDYSEISAADHTDAAAAVAAFRAAGPDLIEQTTGHIWRYYQLVAEEFDEETRRDYGIPSLTAADQVWAHARFTRRPHLAYGDQAYTGGKYAPARFYLFFSGGVDWEEEHGMQLVFANGTDLCFVDQADGHPTLAHAHADVSLLGRITR